MAILVTCKEKQAIGSFAGGLIKENKPIGFPQDGGTQKPYSNLFYWANAWSKQGGLIDRHPHKMFEILSFVIEGEIQHYDTKYDRWLSLKEGDAQIIRAGSGIVHAEKIMENSRMFQIWFDPNIKKTIHHEASYNDYKSSDFLVKKQEEFDNINYTGNGGPIKMESEGVEINELLFQKGKHNILINNDFIYSFYTLNGEALLNLNSIKEHDFIIVKDESTLTIKTENKLRLFEIKTPKQLSYQTYNELVNY